MTVENAPTSVFTIGYRPVNTGRQDVSYVVYEPDREGAPKTKERMTSEESSKRLAQLALLLTMSKSYPNSTFDAQF